MVQSRLSAELFNQDWTIAIQSTMACHSQTFTSCNICRTRWRMPCCGKVHHWISVAAVILCHFYVTFKIATLAFRTNNLDNLATCVNCYMTTDLIMTITYGHFQRIKSIQIILTVIDPRGFSHFSPAVYQSINQSSRNVIAMLRPETFVYRTLLKHSNADWKLNFARLLSPVSHVTFSATNGSRPQMANCLLTYSPWTYTKGETVKFFAFIFKG